MADNLSTAIPEGSFGESSLDDTLKAIQAAAERKSQEESALVTGGPESATPNAATAAPVPDVPVQAPPQGGAQAEVVSARLRKLLEREASLIERENKLRSQETAAPPTSLSLDQLKRLYRTNKVEALKALDPDFKPGAVAKQLWYHDLGDLAPKEAQAELTASYAAGSVEAVRSELEETKQQLLTEIQNHRSELAYQQYVGALQAYTAAVPETMPLVQKFTAKKPDQVVKALERIAQKHYNSSNGQVLSPAQAAAKLEASLKELQLAEPATTSPPAAAPEIPKPAGTPNTLRNKHTATVAPLGPPDDDMSDAVLSKRAFEALERAARAKAGRGF